MPVKLDKTIKLDHLITLAGFIFSLGVFYTLMMTGLDAKAEKAQIMVHEQMLLTLNRDVGYIREENTKNMSRIESYLYRIEAKIDKKADKE